MSDKITKSPQIRFAGFIDAWEQRKLGEVVKRVTRKNKDLESTLPLTISAQDGLIGQNEFFNKTVASRDVSGYYLVRNGEFAYNKSYSNGYPWGAVKRLDRYDKGVLSTLYIVFETTDINSDFLTKYYDTTYWYREVSKHAAEGARNHGLLNIAASDFFETELLVPKDSEEQKKIGDFFNQLDNIIALHYRKLELLKDTKKSLLQKMFPNDGANVPEIRFAGFTDDWEHRKFSYVLDFSISNNTLSRANLNYDKGEVKNIHYGDILVKFDTIVDINSDYVPWVTDGKPEDYKKQRLQNGDVIIADTAEDETTGKAIEVTGITNNFAVSGLHTMVARPNQEFAPKYLGYYLNSPAYHNTLLPLMQGTKVLSLSKANIAKTNVSFPKNAEEQENIGSFFESFDNLITLHQRELNSLKNLKKLLLQQMFV
ncbi:restriction endonuclease subunit S [Sporosarcina sp. D27]|uniref:restriction endonuclease subunit S n=1 Tax=Sporosarcina sp. D27 TaxID=1382305 RepID=UPI00046EB8C0|nr:restriction endonuclease subunit S [Sporosarcina sp. D27]